MKDVRLTLGESFLLAWCLALLGVAGIAISPGVEPAGSWLKSEAAAAWFQAVGSFLAILVAFTLGTRQARAALELEEGKKRVADIHKTEVLHQMFGDCYQVCDELNRASYAQLERDDIQDLVDRLAGLREQFGGLPVFEVTGTGIARAAARAPRELDSLKAIAEKCMRESASHHRELLISEDLTREVRKLTNQINARTFLPARSFCESQLSRLERQSRGTA
jgi:hypothetical protein